jgi:hypothetical protein
LVVRLRTVGLWLSISHVACGRIGFDAHAPMSDAPASDAAIGTPALVHVSTTASSNASATVSIPPTQAGHFILVAVVSYNTDSVASVVDDAMNPYTSAGAHGIITAGGGTEIWFARNSLPDATQVTVTLSATMGLECWVAEFSGVDAGPVDAGAANDQSSGATVVAPMVTTTSSNAVVVSVGAIVTGAKGIDARSPFVSLGIPNGDIASYYIAPVPGGYGAVFDETSSGLSCASSAAFPAAQL